MSVTALLAHLESLESRFANGLEAVAERQASEHDVHFQCLALALRARTRSERLTTRGLRFRPDDEWTSVVVDNCCNEGTLTELRLLFLQAEELVITWTMARQAAMATRDCDLVTTTEAFLRQVEQEAAWLRTKIKAAAPQALLLG